MLLGNIKEVRCQGMVAEILRLQDKAALRCNTCGHEFNYEELLLSSWLEEEIAGHTFRFSLPRRPQPKPEPPAKATEPAPRDETLVGAVSFGAEIEGALSEADDDGRITLATGSKRC